MCSSDVQKAEAPTLQVLLRGRQTYRGHGDGSAESHQQVYQGCHHGRTYQGGRQERGTQQGHSRGTLGVLWTYHQGSLSNRETPCSDAVIH